jgi:hypothetical protein
VVPIIENVVLSTVAFSMRAYKPSPMFTSVTSVWKAILIISSPVLQLLEGLATLQCILFSEHHLDTVLPSDNAVFKVGTLTWLSGHL